MPRYAYRARDAAGRLHGGSIEAADAGEALARLRRRGLTVTGVEPDRDLGNMVRAWLRSRRPGARMSHRDLAFFCRQLGTMVAAGVSLRGALQTLSPGARPGVRSGLERVLASLEGGESLTGALERAALVPPLVVNMVAAGEAGGILDEVLLRLADHYDKEYAVARKVRSALAYPAVVLAAALGVLTLLVTYVFPIFVQFFQQFDAPLPAPTRALLATSQWLRAYGWVLAAGLAAAAVGARAWAASTAGRRRLERLVLALPLGGRLLQLREVSRLARTLGALYRSGVPLAEALAVAERTLHLRLLADGVRAARTALTAGRPMAEPFRRHPHFPPMLADMVAVGEESGTLDAMLARLADYYDREVDAMATQLTALLEPVLVLLLGVIVAVVVVSMFLPLYDLITLFG